MNSSPAHRHPTLPETKSAVDPDDRPLPRFLRNVQTDVNSLRETLRRYPAAATADISPLSNLANGDGVPIAIEDGGATTHMGQLSPGCRACRNGQWECVFPSMDCNLNCVFCLQRRSEGDDAPPSPWASTPAKFLAYLDQADVRGVSISGGEPLVHIDRLQAWLDALVSRQPRPYLWLYTNGLLLTAEICETLRAAGLDEIRFNMAATGYRNIRVLEALRTAAQVLPCVTVEIPAIPEDLDRVLAELANWSEAGVRFLNLHELIYDRNTNAWSMPGKRLPVVMRDGHWCYRNPDSIPAIAEIMKTVNRLNLPMSVNACTMRGKAWQMKGRRRLAAPRLLRAHEILIQEEYAESCCAFDSERVEFFAPTGLQEARQRFPGFRFARLTRLLPLAPDQPDLWTRIDFFA